MTVMPRISNTEELLENVKAHFWFTMKNPVEILLWSNPAQQLFRACMSTNTGTCWHLKRWPGYTVPFPLCATHTPPPLPPSGHFTPVCSAIHFRRRVTCWMLKHIMQEEFLPLKDLLYKILQHAILWWVDLDWLPAAHPAALPVPLHRMGRRK